MTTVIRGRVAAATAGLALAVASFGVIACGDDESSTTATTSAATTEETTSTDSTIAAATSGGTFAAAAAALEADGFALEDKGGDELVQTIGLPKPITATAGAVVTRSGSSGDLLVYEFETPEDAEAVAKANTDDIVQSEAVGTLVVMGTTNNTDLLDQALAAIG